MLCLGSLGILPTTGWSALSPEQVLILVNQDIPESIELGHYYAKQRGIPTRNLIKLPLSSQEAISREAYESTLLTPLKEVVEARQLAGHTRVLVTIYGVPLRIKKPKPTPMQEQWQSDASRWLTATAGLLESLRTEIEDLRGNLPESFERASVGTPSTKKKKHKSDPIDGVINDIQTSFTRIIPYVQKLPDSAQNDQRKKDLARLIQRFQGVAGLAFTTASQGAPLPTSLPWLQSDQLPTIWSLLIYMAHEPGGSHRDKAYQLTQHLFGLKGVATLAQLDLDHWKFKEAEASVDSELSLIWWTPDLYDLPGRFPNPLFSQPDASERLAEAPPVLMVGRLDAPSPALVKNMIDMAIMAEQFGLNGRAYFDAKGQKPDRHLGYGYYDQNIRDAAALIKEHTQYEVVLENTKRRLSQPGEAPHVGMYVGWYRLRAYEDAFSFNPGAIGYHIASAEAVSLHDPHEPGWCKNALERGITVTLGPTSEPYLDAFPLPTDFLGLLQTGQYALVEAFYLTTRYLSWTMTVIGDPLYNPWKGKTTLSVADLSRYSPLVKQLGGLPTPPSELPLPSPETAAQKIRDSRRALLQKLAVSFGG